MLFASRHLNGICTAVNNSMPKLRNIYKLKNLLGVRSRLSRQGDSLLKKRGGLRQILAWLGTYSISIMPGFRKVVHAPPLYLLQNLRFIVLLVLVQYLKRLYLGSYLSNLADLLASISKTDAGGHQNPSSFLEPYQIYNNWQLTIWKSSSIARRIPFFTGRDRLSSMNSLEFVIIFHNDDWTCCSMKILYLLMHTRPARSLNLRSISTTL